MDENSIRTFVQSLFKREKDLSELTIRKVRESYAEQLGVSKFTSPVKHQLKAVVQEEVQRVVSQQEDDTDDDDDGNDDDGHSIQSNNELLQHDEDSKQVEDSSPGTAEEEIFISDEEGEKGNESCGRDQEISEVKMDLPGKTQDKIRRSSSREKQTMNLKSSKICSSESESGEECLPITRKQGLLRDSQSDSGDEAGRSMNTQSKHFNQVKTKTKKIKKKVKKKVEFSSASDCESSASETLMQIKKPAKKMQPKLKEHQVLQSNSQSSASDTSVVVTDNQSKSRKSKGTISSNNQEDSDSEKQSSKCKKKRPRSGGSVTPEDSFIKKKQKVNFKTSSRSTESSKIKNLERIARHCGALPRGKMYAEKFKGCDSETSRVKVIKQLLRDAGMEGRPSMQKAEQLKLLKEAAELDTGNIIQGQVIGRRGAGRLGSGQNSVTCSDSADDKTTIQENPGKSLFSRLKGIVDSDQSD